MNVKRIPGYWLVIIYWLVLACAVTYLMNVIAHQTKPRAYQIDLDQQRIYLYDGNRLVTTFSIAEDSCIGSAILKDNL